MRKEYHIRDKEKNKSISIYGNKEIAVERFNKVKIGMLKETSL